MTITETQMIFCNNGTDDAKTIKDHDWRDGCEQMRDKLQSDNKILREALEKIANHSPRSVDKVVLLVNIDGYRACAREALEKIK